MKIKERTIWFILIIVSSLMTGCYKDAHLIDENFVGIWNSQDGMIGLEIFSESQGSYSIQGSGEITYGKVKVKNNERYMKIEDLKFQINQLPRYDSTYLGKDYYSMILDQVVFISAKQ